MLNAEPVTFRGVYQVLTAVGPAAIAVIRIRGPAAAAFAGVHLRARDAVGDSWSAGRVLRAELLDADGAPIDDILVSVHAGPPDWDLRLHLHANPCLVRRCAELLEARGLTAADAARPTTLWPVSDTLEAEMLTLLPHALTLRGADWLLGNADRLRAALASLLAAEDWVAARQTCRAIADRFRVVGWFTRPLRVALVGPTNAGKSTLANALADRPVSIVSPHPATTRDWVEADGEADGFPLTWLDTAGLRRSADPLEAASVERTHRLLRAVDATIVVLDATPAAAAARAAFLAAYGDLAPVAVALNKSDACQTPNDVVPELPVEWRRRAVAVSAGRRTGLDILQSTLLESLGRTGAALDQPAAFSTRQVELLERAGQAASRDLLKDIISQMRVGSYE